MLYKLTPEQHQAIKEASKPVPLLYLASGQPMFESSEERINNAWKKLGEELGFDWETAKPIPGEPNDIFEFEATPIQ